MEKARLWGPEYESNQKQWFLSLIDLLKTRARLLPDFVTNGRAFLSDEYEIEAYAQEKFLKEPSLKLLLPELASRLDALSGFDSESCESTLRKFAEEKQVKAGLLINAARVLLTGKAVAPGIFQVMNALGQRRTVTRLRKVF